MESSALAPLGTATAAVSLMRIAKLACEPTIRCILSGLARTNQWFKPFHPVLQWTNSISARMNHFFKNQSVHINRNFWGWRSISSKTNGPLKPTKRSPQSAPRLTPPPQCPVRPARSSRSPFPPGSRSGAKWVKKPTKPVFSVIFKCFWELCFDPPQGLRFWRPKYKNCPGKNGQSNHGTSPNPQDQWFRVAVWR